jgi:hypothetical protein
LEKSIAPLFKGTIYSPARRAKGHPVILYHEEGVTIPSNTKSYYCRPFINEKENYLDLFIDLAKALNNEGLL